MRRPTSVTVISWSVLILAAVNLCILFSGNWNRNRLFDISQTEALLGMVLAIFMAVFMLRGANWARWLYVGQLIIGAITVPFISESFLAIALGAIKATIFTFFLTKKDANLFFRQNAKASKLPNSANT